MNKSKSKRTEIVFLKINNWAKYQIRKELKSMHYFRVQNDIFRDAKFCSLTISGKVFWIHLMCEATIQYVGGNPDRSAGQVQCNIMAASMQTGINARYIRSSLDDLERLQIVTILERHAFAPTQPENVPIVEKSRIEKSRIESSSDLLTKHEYDAKLISSTSQISKKNKTKSEKKPETKTAKTWEVFSNAYRKRYGSEPVRNASTNSQMMNVVKRIGEEESPEVVAHYLTLNETFYSSAGHSVGMLLRDCEKIRMMWATGKRTTVVDTKASHWRDQAQRIETGEL